MSSELASPPQTVSLPRTESGFRHIGNWIYRFIVFPVGQMIVFIVGASVLLTALSYLLAFFVPEPRPNILLADQIGAQLPGMIIAGIGTGFLYAMIALGYTLVYGVLKFINFAHSEIFMVGSVIGFEFMRRIFDAGLLGAWSPVFLILVTVLLAMLASGTLAVIIERVAYRPLRGAPRLVPLITAIGISYVLIDSTRAIMTITRNDFNLTYPTNEISYLSTPIPLAFNGLIAGGFIAPADPEAQNFPPIYDLANIGGTRYDSITVNGVEYDQFIVDEGIFDYVIVGGVSLGGDPVRVRNVRVGEAEERPDAILIGGADAETIIDASNVVNVRITSIIVVISAVIMLILLNYFVNGTKLGRGIRAVSQDQATAGLMGINANRMISLTFFIGGAFGGAAGALYGLNAGTVTPYVGFIPGVKAFTAAVLGGIGNVTGALLGGITLGLIEAFLNGILVYFPALGQRYTDIFAFSVLILILIFRPSGILGERVDEKV
ncbi:MAG: branched-chain amino acid ABC transporter permease [bacterium]|nr:branched-chain amino acid ABC transporter permease [bacterium]